MTTNRSTYRIILLSAFVTCFGIEREAPAIPPRYHVTDLGYLGTLSQQFSEGYGINARGQVVGTSGTDLGIAHAFLWTPTTPNGTTGTMIDLGTLDAPGSIAFSSGASGINDSGQVTGTSNVTTLSNEHRAFLWTPTKPNGASGTMVDLGTPGEYGYGTGLNDRGQVTGSDLDSFLWAPTTPNAASGMWIDWTELGGIPIASGFAINADGQVTGLFSPTTESNHAFLWTPMTPNDTTGALHDLGTLGGTASWGLAINASGQVVGRASTDDESVHAFLWTPTTPNGAIGAMRDLGTIGGGGSVALAINDHGTIIGVSETVEEPGRAFIFSSTDGMLDLNSLIDTGSGWLLQSANAINNIGQITGYGDHNGVRRAFLLTPVPEPASAVLFALAALGLVLTIARREHGFPCAGRSLVGLSILLFASAGSASAAIYSASNVAELIAAIDAANQNAEPDSINLAAATTFTLTEVNNGTGITSTGLPTISATENLTILGNGGIIERSAAIGTARFRLFEVTSGAALSLENLTLQGGLTFGVWEGGAAIHNLGALALTNVTVQNNIADGLPGSNCIHCGGGGVPSTGGPGRFALGGGIYSAGSLLMQNSTLQENQARGGSGGLGPGGRGRGGDGRGGGLYVAAGSATLYNSFAMNNVVAGGAGVPSGQGVGGGLYIADAQAGLDEFTLAQVTGNTASTSYPNIYGPFDSIANPNPLPGDYNGDGEVDSDDLTVWQGAFGTGNGADADGDGDSDGVDFLTWQRHVVPTAPQAPLATVPEPAAILLSAIGVFGLGKRRRKSGR